MPSIFILIILAIIIIAMLRLLFSGRQKSTSYQSNDFTRKKMSKEKFQKRMAGITNAKVYGKKDESPWKNKHGNEYKNPFTDPWNPVNPNSLRNPMNPLNPTSPLNTNNPANPNTQNNPANINNPLGINNPNSPNYFDRKR